MQKIDFAYKEALVILTLSLLTAIFCYTKIHLKLRHQQAQLHNNVPQGPIAIEGWIPLNKARFKKTVSSILWVQLALAACYIPLGIVIALYIWKWNMLRSFESYGDCTLPKLVPKLDPVLLEDQRSKTGSERHVKQFYCFKDTNLFLVA